MSDSLVGRTLFTVAKVSLLIISLFLFGIAWFLCSDILERDNWPTTKGKVFESQTVAKQGEMLGRKVKYYDLNIRYGYIVDKIRYNKTGLFLKQADKRLELSYFKQKEQEFKKGDVVKVHYNPQNPKQAYLVPEIASGMRSFYDTTQKMLILSIFLFLISPFISMFRDKKYIEKNTFEQGLIVPDSAKVIPAHKRGK